MLRNRESNLLPPTRRTGTFTNGTGDASITRNASNRCTPIPFATCGAAPRSALHRAVQQALYLPRRWLRAGLLAAGIAGVIPHASASPFPPVFPLADLLPASGGDGSAGFVLTGIDPSDWVGQVVSAAGDINGDGIDDLIIGARHADPYG